MHQDTSSAREATAQRIRVQRDLITQHAADHLFVQMADQWSRDNDAMYAKALRDIGLHLDYLTDSLDVNDESVYFGYVESTRILFDTLGVGEDVLPMTLASLGHAVRAVLPQADGERAGTLLQNAYNTFHLPPAPDDDHWAEAVAMTPLAEQYLAALLQMDRSAAHSLITTAVVDGMAVRDVYLDIFQRTMREIGRLWQLDRITVAQEHFSTAATQQIMAQLAPYLYQGEKKGRRVIATCTGGELHELGLRMVADFFEMDGWDSLFLGANMPAESIVVSLDEFQPDLLAVSVTINRHVSRVGALINRVRAARRPVKVLVGGYPFLANPELWQEIGADGYALDALQAVAVGNELVANHAH